MVILQCKNLEKSYGEINIFSNINFSIEENKKIALIGRNGVGKTTLLNCIINPSLLDKGEIITSNNLSIGYLEQNFEDENISLEEHLLSSFQEILNLREEIYQIEKEISIINDIPKREILLTKYASTLNQYETINGYRLESNITGIINGLGLDKNDLRRKLSSFSGGEKSKIALASLLIKRPSLLILDEPTNHLDITTTEWLETHLKNYEGSIFIISHDRRFLDNLVDEIFELENNQIINYKGNYSKYEIEKENNLKLLLKNFEKQQKIIKKTEDYIQKNKAGNNSKQARGRQKYLDKIVRIEKNKLSKEINLASMKTAEESGNLVLSVKELTQKYGNKLVLNKLNFDIFRKEKIGLLGDNGAGKSTLLQIILNQLQASQGEIIIGSRVTIGYFEQNHKSLDINNTVYREILKHFDYTKEEIRGVLAQFLFFEDDIDKPISVLSGGEKARLSLMIVLLKNPNFLILDEPTNHLDLESQKIIEKYLSEFEGTLLLVSHDRFLLDNLVDKIFLIKNQTLEIFYGNFTYFKEKQKENIFKEEQEHKSQKIENKTTKNKIKSRSKLKSLLEEYEKEMNLLEKNIDLLRVEVNQIDTRDYQKFQSLSLDIEANEDQIEDLYKKWEKVLMDLEALENEC